MPDIFDNIGNFFRSIFQNGEEYTDEDGNKRFYDPDMQEAWEELDDYLNEDKTEKKQKAKTHTRSRAQQQADAIKKIEQEKLRQDYNTLKVKFGTSFSEVKKAYKKLVIQYHPDKHANDPKRFKMATEITQKINQAFQRIKNFEKKYAS